MDLAALLVRRIEALRRDQPRYTVALDGPDAAGKTTLATALVARIGEVPPRAVLVLDGVFLQLPALRPYWDLVVYLHVSPELSRERGMARDARRGDSLEDLKIRYRDRYLPGQAMYRAECNPEASADILADMTDPTNPTVVRG